MGERGDMGEHGTRIAPASVMSRGMHGSLFVAALSIALVGCAAAAPDQPASQLLRIELQRAWSVTMRDAACLCAADAVEWRRCREALGSVARELPSVPCDFTTHKAVVVVEVPSQDRRPLEATVVTEEGVDVLLVEPLRDEDDGPQHTGRGFRSRMLLVVVPQRPRSLAVVLRSLHGEQTLAVFAPRD